MPDWEVVKASLPVSQSPEDKEQRKKLWRQFNLRGGKHLALFEVDNAILKVLGCEELFHAKPVIQKAFAYAREINPKGEAETLDFSEFRLLLCYLKGLFDIYLLFKNVDTAGDMALSLEELQAAKEELAAAGVPCEDPAALFAQLKGTNDNVDFHEFSDWAIRHNMGGAELLEKAEVLDREQVNELKEQLQQWELCTNGTISKEDFKAILLILDAGWTENNFDKLCMLKDAPIKGDQVDVDPFVEFLFAK